MSGPLLIQQGPSSAWWLSPAIWLTEAAPPHSIVGSPVAGKTYNVQVQVENPYPEPVSGGWSLLVFWSVPIVGGFPLAYSASPPSPLQSDNILNGQLKGGYWEGLPITQTVPAGSGLSSPGSVTIQAAESWTPSFENGGHECLIAFAYLEQATGLPLTTVQGNDPWTQVSTVAQHNLGVLAATHMRHFNYPFRVSNALAESHAFDIAAQIAPLSSIASFLPNLPGGRSILDQAGKVEHLGLIEGDGKSADHHGRSATLAGVHVPHGSHRTLSLVGTLPHGNALVNVTQSLHGHVVGGLSVLLLEEKKA